MAIILGILIGLVVGAAGVFFVMQFMGKNALDRAKKEAEELKENALGQAQNKAKEIELTARQERLKAKEQYERETEANRNELKSCFFGHSEPHFMKARIAVGAVYITVTPYLATMRQKRSGSGQFGAPSYIRLVAPFASGP